jgi:hypothetical protein
MLYLKPNRVIIEIKDVLVVHLQALKSKCSSDVFYQIDMRIRLILDFEAVVLIFLRVCHNCLVAINYLLQCWYFTPRSRGNLLFIELLKFIHDIEEALLYCKHPIKLPILLVVKRRVEMFKLLK